MKPSKKQYNSHEVLTVRPSGLYKMVYHQWGEITSPNILIAVHGLTGNGRQFDRLAEILSPDYCILALDVIGRGQSPWATFSSEYSYEYHLNDLQAFFIELQMKGYLNKSITYVGTSMGGLLGILLASFPNSPIKRLILNDIGPEIGVSGVNDIIQASKRGPLTASNLEQYKIKYQQYYQSYGPLEKNAWDELVKYDHRINNDGNYIRKHDPKINDAFKVQATQMQSLWGPFKAIKCPIFIIRGKESKLLENNVYQQMIMQENVDGVEIEGVGHAPSLMREEELNAINNWLEKH